MKEQRSDYNAFPKEANIQEDTPFGHSSLNDLAAIINGYGHNFDLLMLFEVIFKKLHPLFSIDCGALVLYDKGLSKIVRSYVSVYSLAEGGVCSEVISDPVSLSLLTTEIAGFGFPVLKSRENWMEELGQNHCPHNSGEDYLFHCYVPLEINNETLGTLELHNHHKELSAEGLTFCCNIADLLAELIVAANKESGEPIKFEVRQAIDSAETTSDFSQLISLSNELTLVRTKEEIINIIRKHIKKLFKYNYLHIFQECAGEEVHSSLKSLFKETNDESQVNVSDQIKDFAYDDVLTELRTYASLRILTVETMEELGWKPHYINELKAAGVHTQIVCPLRAGSDFLGVILIGLHPKQALTSAKRLLLQGIFSQFSIALSNVVAYECIKDQLEEINVYRQQLEEEQLYLPEELVFSANFEDIIGESKEMQQVFNLLTNVSGSETTVLILGETGTGKELIAKAIHNASERKGNQMVKVNCAAIPPNLIESELFGHEKGSFTGATERRIGKFELADKSTLFLDEIGELSLDLQVKLLRVLQEKEIERVGGKTTIPTDVRIVSATNRNLMEEVEAGRFRSDLFYRLNVFPISLPPLRKRKEDIPLLASHFLSRFTSKSGKKIDGFSQKVLSDMKKYGWPGNIRELEHLIERQVLLTKGPIIKELQLPADRKVMVVEGTEFAPVKTITENERDHIFAVLQLCNGKISGKDGAAWLLGVPATTLNSKIKRLGLAKKHMV